ncbi:MAG: LemA family protein [Bacteroidales bacterium]|jgi:LemA protein|nr:LemA family protein [Bacteroidales bacterium]
MSITLIVIIAIVAICLLYILSTQRQLVSLQEKMKNAIGQINAQLKTRWDAVTALVEMTKQYDAHEYDTLMDVIGQRKISTPSTAEDVNQQNAAVNDILGRLNVVVERYPELKANDVFNNSMNGIKQYEENVRLSRMVYNDCVTKLNTMVRQWPSSIVANMLHFTTAEYLAEDKEKSEMPGIGSIFNGGKNS